MGLMYTCEHTSCCNYSADVREGFHYNHCEAGAEREEVMKIDTVIFLLGGSLTFTCQANCFVLSAGQMAFLHRGTRCKMQMLQACDYIQARFEGGTEAFQKSTFAELSKNKANVTYRMESMPIKDRMNDFLEMMIGYLKDGANCIRFHEIKLREMFWLFRFYYSKEERTRFFYMVIGESGDFKSKVLNHYKESKTVKKLAEACGISLSAFKRQFSSEFGESVSSWMQKQLLGDIQFRLLDTDRSLTSIANELEFSSLAQFSRYCKKNLGYAPSELRELLKERSFSAGNGS